MRALRVLPILGAAALLAVHHAATAPAAEPPATGTASEHRPTLVALAPGTQVTGPRALPRGWSHLVIKSLPRLASGELASLPSVAQQTAGLFRATVLVDVAPAGRSFELRRVGIGLCTPIKGVDTVVTSATADRLHAGLGFVGRKVLEEAEQELWKGRIKARTPTFALYSAPSTRRTSRGHEAILVRYAFLVDPATGDLQTLLWCQARDPRVRKPPEQLVLLPPGLIDDAALDVEAQRVLNTVPVNWSFAMVDLPDGKRLTPTPAVRAWSVRDALAPADAAGFERDLRQILAAERQAPAHR